MNDRVVERPYLKVETTSALVSNSIPFSVLFFVGYNWGMYTGGNPRSTAPLLLTVVVINALHRDHLPQLFQKPPGPVREQSYYQSLLTDENVGLLVAVLNGNLVGFVHALIRDT